MGLSINDVQMVKIVENVPPTGLHYGAKDVAAAGTAEALAASQALMHGVTVRAKTDNTGIIYVGDSDVDSTNGFELEAGESILIYTDNLANVYIDASVNEEGVSYIGS
jgi:hypothetical protein